MLNIVVNAAHAIADVVKDSDKKGLISVRTRQQGQSVLITISDTGTGIPEQVRARIFDPFFTNPSSRSKQVGSTTSSFRR